MPLTASVGIVKHSCARQHGFLWLSGHCTVCIDTQHNMVCNVAYNFYKAAHKVPSLCYVRVQMTVACWQVVRNSTEAVAYLLVSKGNSEATTLLDVAPLQDRVQHRIQLLLDVLNEQWLAK